MGTGHVYGCIPSLRPQQHVTLLLVILREGESGSMQVPHVILFFIRTTVLMEMLYH